MSIGFDLFKVVVETATYAVIAEEHFDEPQRFETHDLSKVFQIILVNKILFVVVVLIIVGDFVFLDTVAVVIIVDNAYG